MGEGGYGMGLRARDARLCDALASARSIGQSMPSVLGFADEVVDGFVIGESTTHVGVVQFNGDAQLLLPLSADEGSVREAIARGGPSYGYTSISDGIDAAMATLGGHGRAGVPVTMLVLTDGVQTVDGGDVAAIAAAAAARAQGVQLFAVGFGPGPQLSTFRSDVYLTHFRFRCELCMHWVLNQIRNQIRI